MKLKKYKCQISNQEILSRKTKNSRARKNLRARNSKTQKYE